MKFSLPVLLAVGLIAFSVTADAKRCANGQGYRYINGQKVCPEEMTRSQPRSRPLTYDDGENDAWLGVPAKSRSGSYYEGYEDEEERDEYRRRGNW